ncbi:hypothetical protein LB565_04290 [Mesorhizobium sp. CA14]|uniref:hypothetical protein n=1 Tax=Mesorhizobium sp. CA14 TaxID=2876642 RepID=UPI001CCB78B7|nr:hypothetical protein [Mesorhizobium sp. CA14]MBZ9847207.1 hypothetical protein [Mesorhizobium sp. CA14]
MSDTAFKTAPFASYTTEQLRAHIANIHPYSGTDTAERMSAEIARREAVAAGDVSVMTPSERLRFIKSGKAR